MSEEQATQSDASSTLARPMQLAAISREAEHSLPSPISRSPQLPDHLQRRSDVTSDQSYGYTAGEAHVQDLPSLDSFESLLKHQQQLEARQKLENERITRVLRDVAAVEEKIADMESTYGSDLRPCFAHIRRTCLAECIKMVAIIRPSPTEAVQTVRDVGATAREPTIEAVNMAVTEEPTTRVQTKEGQHHIESVGNDSARPSRFFVGRPGRKRASACRADDPIEDGSSAVVVMDEENPVEGNGDVVRMQPDPAVEEHGDGGESNYGDW
ncbi:hypothetical protein DM02DRAFT_620729 [Periconia macrospinosa]|uniref:Uncharacterized protein n=1 Tax=Periconia macrospinosa TaxID=97972 RepID=A0A2V1D0P4_9PLEO|nr:hypothetical protein DM02DRAFT_620729 [Periconia macrospinosa]